MLNFVVIALAFASPTSSKTEALSRRQAVGRLLGATGATLALGASTAARAEMYGDGKAADKSQGAVARQLKFAKAGEETEAFKQAEAKREEAQRRIESGRTTGLVQKATEETAEEAMARLGLRTYTQAVSAGFDECATWRGCNR